MSEKVKEIELLNKYIKDANNPYLNYHAKRYEKLILFIKEKYTAKKRILDIGNSPFAEIASKLFKCDIDELGFAKDSSRTFGKQYQFNLNDSHDKELWRSDIGPYDLIIFAEVIEHLYTSPSHVLNYLFTLLEEKGTLILQTPNATVLHKRIQLIFGKNPYMLIRENRFNPGHFREYTKNELVGYAKNCGFKIVAIEYSNYFDYQYTHAQSRKNEKNKYLKLINLLYSILPNSLKPGITMILRKE